MPREKITILINQRPFHFEVDTLVPGDLTCPQFMYQSL